MRPHAVASGPLWFWLTVTTREIVFLTAVPFWLRIIPIPVSVHVYVAALYVPEYWKPPTLRTFGPLCAAQAERAAGGAADRRHHSGAAVVAEQRRGGRGAAVGEHRQRVVDAGLGEQ
jgi:hypothetical protein